MVFYLFYNGNTLITKGIFFVLLSVLLSCSSSIAPSPDSLNLAVPYEIDTVDPHAKTWLSNFAISSHFYEGLVRTDSNMRIQPSLAKEWENPDVYTWIFRLRPSVRFHSGKLLDAEDVVYSFRRLLNSSNLEIATYLNDVQEVTALDSTTVKIRTSIPLAILLNKLCNVFIIPKGSTAKELTKKVNGTGPYRMTGWKQGQFIRMVRNENYWGKKPFMRNVTYYLGQSPRQAIRSLASRKCQFAQYDSKSLENVVRGFGDFRVYKHDNLFLKYLSYDVSRDVTPYCKIRPNPFKNKLVRQAIHMGIDRSRLVSELPTYATPASQPVPAFVFGFNPAIILPPYDLEGAKRLLAKAGYPDGFEVTMHERQILAETGILIKQQLERIGIRVDLKVLPDQEFFNALDDFNFTIFLSRVGATVGDASDILEPQLHTKDVSKRLGVRNWVGYSNSEVDSAIEESAGMLKLEERRSVLQQIMSRLMEDLPWIPLYIDQDVYAVQDSLVWRPRSDSYILAHEISLR